MTAQQVPRADRLLTPAQVAALVFVDPKTVSRWERAGKLPAARTPGGHRRFRMSDVQALIERQRASKSRPVRAGAPLLSPRDASASGTAALIASEAVVTASAMRSRSAQQARRLAEAAEHAETFVVSSGKDAQTMVVALRMAATVQAAVDVASADTAAAAAHLARAFTDAAAHMAAVVAELDISVERALADTADALQHITAETAPRSAPRYDGPAPRSFRDGSLGSYWTD